MGPTTLVEWLPSMVDGVIAFTFLEGALLALHHRRTGAGVAPRDFVANMVSGLCLMAGLRVALVHGAHPGVALALLAAGLVHGADLWRRWQRR